MSTNFTDYTPTKYTKIINRNTYTLEDYDQDIILKDGDIYYIYDISISELTYTLKTVEDICNQLDAKKSSSSVTIEVVDHPEMKGKYIAFEDETAADILQVLYNFYQVPFELYSTITNGTEISAGNNNKQQMLTQKITQDITIKYTINM